MPQEYSIREFILAQIEAHQFRQAHPDLRRYFDQKAVAYRAAFRMPLDHSVFQEMTLDRDMTLTLEYLFRSAMDSYVAIRTPFSGYLEVTREWVDLSHQYGPAFVNLVEQMRAVHMDFMVALLERWYGFTTRTISSEDLHEHGFDDHIPGPDPLDYF